MPEAMNYPRGIRWSNDGGVRKVREALIYSIENSD